jgi:hypothetical protein
MIKNIVRINNRFHERSLEKKGSYNFGKRQGNRKKKWGDPIELDAIYRTLLSKKKQDKQRQKDLYYKYSLLGHQAAFYRQKKKKRF